jgi:Beta-glucanase/Beta-glucan synthetase
LTATQVDTSKWTFEIGTGSSGWGNNEKEYYTGRKENAYVQDGILHIRANKEDYEGSGYTSARMITKGKFTFTYGTVEARIALPVGKGIWPAFWMLGENIDKVSWPACGEIDIIEAINDESIVYGTHHWQYEGQHASYGNNTSDFHGAKKDWTSRSSTRTKSLGTKNSSPCMSRFRSTTKCLSKTTPAEPKHSISRNFSC